MRCPKPEEGNVFGGKKQPQYPWNEPAGEAKYEYYTLASLGIDKFNADVNALAQRGWELIGGVMAGTAHYGYMRREIRRVLSILVVLAALPGFAFASAPQATKGPAATASKAEAAKAVEPAPPAPIPEVYYDFKNARLGMTLEEWKASPSPKLKVFKNGEFADSDQTGTAICDAASRSLSQDQKALGAVLCYYERPRSHYLPIGSLTADYVHYIFLDGKLSRINVGADANAFDEVMSGLTAKFGEATEKADDTTQNRAGANFPHHVRMWSNPAATILVETPYTKINDLIVVYETTESGRRIEAQHKKDNPPAEKM